MNKKYFVIFASVALGFIMGAASTFFYHPYLYQTRGFPIRETGYTFISPILGFEAAAQSRDFYEFQFLDDRLHDAVREQKKLGKATNISVYFRALKSGHWVGVEENEEFEAASLLKVATVIAYYKASEEDPALLKRVFTMNKEIRGSIQEQDVEPQGKLKIGSSYSASELAERALIYSDNDAVNLLSTALTQSNIIDVVTDLSLPIHDNKIETLSPKSYSFVLRVLFNATYLSRDMSEKILEIMSRSTFKEGLAKGVPSTMPVANKFGEWVLLSPNAEHSIMEVDFHDCGIIYYPDHPYFLCVMTRGTDYHSQIEAIASISKTVYDAVDYYWTSGNR